MDLDNRLKLYVVRVIFVLFGLLVWIIKYVLEVGLFKKWFSGNIFDMLIFRLLS